MVAPQGKRKLEQFLAEQGGAGLSPRMIVLVADARAQWAEIDRRISAFDAEFVRWVKENSCIAGWLSLQPGQVLANEAGAFATSTFFFNPGVASPIDGGY